MSDLIDHLTDRLPRGLDPNVISDWLYDKLDSKGPWSTIDDERLKISSLLACRLHDVDSDTYELRQKLYKENNQYAWMNVVTEQVLPCLYTRILDDER